jgi:HK97 family phage major capsid protein
VVVTSEQYKAMIGQYPGGRIPDRARVQSDPIPVKSLFTGASDTSGGAFVVADQSGIVEMLGRRPLVIRDVISVRRTGSDAVEYVRQTSHTNTAAPVAEATTAALPTQDGSTGPLVQAAGGGYKPEGAWAFERDSTPVRTIAEWVPATKRALADVAQLEGLIRDELSADLAETEETEIMSGSGSGEHLTGILNTSGTQAQAWSNNILETLRKAITKARVTGRSVPNGIGLNPADVETIDLLQDNEGRYYGMGPFAMGPRTVWGVPIVESEAVPSGTGVVADWSKAVLWDREQATVTMTDSHADFFIRNLVAILG